MIKTVTTLTEEHVKAFQTYQKKINHSGRKLFIVVIWLLLLFIFGIYFVKVSFEKVFGGFIAVLIFIFGIIMLGTGIKYVLLLLMHTDFEPDGTLRTVVFSDEETEVYTESDVLYSEYFTDYDSILSAAESGDWFFIKFNEQSGTVFHRDDFTDGTPDELRELLKSRLGKKFSCQT